MLLSRSLTLAALGLCLIVAGCDRQGSAPAQPQASASAPASPAAGTIDRSHRGSAMPDLVFKGFRGEDHTLAALKGQPVLINLWATWCAPCVAELPKLDALAQSGTVRVVLVSQDSGPPDKVLQFLEAHGRKLENWLDPQNEMSFHYESGVLPTTLYYDAQGREVWRMIGERDWADAQTAGLLAETADR